MSHKFGEEIIEGYRLVAKLGEGGFGEVWKATAPGDFELALKIVRLDWGEGKKELDSLKRVRGLSHPNLVSYISAWVKDSSGYLVSTSDQLSAMESARGRMAGGTMAIGDAVAVGERDLIIAMTLCEESLANRLKRMGMLDPADVVACMVSSARALDFLQTKSIVHCDIKPQNILVVQGNECAICDYGLVRNLESNNTNTKLALSVQYAPPERWSGRIAPTTDQYSLAVTYLELRTGRQPFANTTGPLEIMKAHAEGALDLSLLPVEEQEIIRKATSPNPELRYATCGEMVRALQRVVNPESRRLPQPASGGGVAADTTKALRQSTRAFNDDAADGARLSHGGASGDHPVDVVLLV